MNEETILQGQTMANGNENPNNEQNNSSAWKPVSIGGVAGILMGAGAMYAAQAYATRSETEEQMPEPTPQESQGVKVAEVSDSMSFKEAFDAARDQVGAGGVFRWHGGIYNTYTAEEWNAMTDAEKGDFAELVKPEISAANIDANQITEATPNVHVHVHVHEAAQVTQEAPVASSTDDVRVNDTHAAQSQDDDDVRLVATGNYEGHNVYGYDVNGDDQPDVAIIDVDGSGDPSAPDVVIDSEGNMATLGELAEMAQDPAMDPNLQAASNDNPDVAPDMPDYMSDANLDVIA